MTTSKPTAQTHLFTLNVVTRSSAQHLQNVQNLWQGKNTSLILSASKGNLEPKHWNIPHKSNYLQPKQQWVGQHSYKYTVLLAARHLARLHVFGLPHNQLSSCSRFATYLFNAESILLCAFVHFTVTLQEILPCTILYARFHRSRSGWVIQ